MATTKSAAQPENVAAAADATLSGPMLALYARLGAWRRHAPGLYGVCQTQMLEWPSLAVEWLPDRRNSTYADFALHSVAVGSQALPGSLNYVSVIEVAIPVDMEEMADYLRGDDGVIETSRAMYADIKGHTRLAQLLPVDGAVHKIRAMPQAPDVLAITTSASANIPIYRLDNRPTHSADPQDHRPDVVLRGLKSPGFAVEFSPVTPGNVIAGSDDGGLAMWDAASMLDELYEELPDGAAPNGRGPVVPVQPSRKFQSHRDIVHDVSCHATHPHLFASASHDKSVCVWDDRVALSASHVIAEAHVGGAFGCSFHPTAVYNLATCGADGIVALWDIRRPEVPAANLVYHTAGVAGVQWAPFSESALLSYGLDGNVCLWDMARSGLPASNDGDKAAPCELAFVHTGHMSRVTEARFCPNVDDEWLVASCDATNMLQVFRPLHSILEEHLPADEFDADVAEE